MFWGLCIECYSSITPVAADDGHVCGHPVRLGDMDPVMRRKVIGLVKACRPWFVYIDLSAKDGKPLATDVLDFAAETITETT